MTVLPEYILLHNLIPYSATLFHVYLKLLNVKSRVKIRMIHAPICYISAKGCCKLHKYQAVNEDKVHCISSHHSVHFDSNSAADFKVLLMVNCMLGFLKLLLTRKCKFKVCVRIFLD